MLEFIDDINEKDIIKDLSNLSKALGECDVCGRSLSSIHRTICSECALLESVKKETKQQINPRDVAYYKIIKEIPNTEYSKGFTLVSANRKHNRLWMWFIGRKGKRKNRYLTTYEVSALVSNGNIEKVNKYAI